MEYELIDYGENRKFSEWGKSTAPSAAIKRKLGAGDARVSVRACGRAGRRLRACRAPSLLPLPNSRAPSVNIMDEISYWVHTKRAPCLMNYDNQIKKQYEISQGSRDFKSDLSATDGALSPKKKKRKLSLLDEDCASQGKRQNVYFEAPQRERRTVLSSCKSETLESDIDFNIKKSSIQDNPKRIKIQKNGRTLHKKNKVVTSTPLRRSLRRIKNGFNTSGQSNILDTNNCSIDNTQTESKNGRKTSHSTKKYSTRLHDRNRNIDIKKDESKKLKNQTVQNGQFEDMSDVSGFTASYIRSTKVHSNGKPHRNIRNKANRNLMNESQQRLQKNNQTMLVCVNKSVNAAVELPHCAVLNSSTDSSQNVINLITTKNNEKSTKVNKSTSLLKFVDSKTPKVKESDSDVKIDRTQLTIKTDMDTSLQSQTTSTSRYPKRNKNHSTDRVTMSSSGNILLNRVSSNRRKKTIKNSVDVSNSERKENPEIALLSRTRSGRNSALALRHPENSVFVYSTTTEPVSSINVMNVASPRGKAKIKRLSSLQEKRSLDQSAASLYKDSVREKSGFTACFSESDDDIEALKQRKFFC